MSEKKNQYPRLERRKVSSVKAHPDGVRSHTSDSLYLLGKSVEQFGLLRLPVLNVRTGNLIDGDLLLEALRHLSTEEVDFWCVDVPEELEDVAHLALNNHAGEWQWRPVSEHLKAVQALGLPMGLTGFHASDYGPLTAADWSPAPKGPMDGSGNEQGSLL
jgi:hypothetical protein